MEFEVDLSEKDYRKFIVYNSIFKNKAPIFLSLFIIVISIIDIMFFGNDQTQLNYTLIVFSLFVLIFWIIKVIRMMINTKKFINTDKILIGHVQKYQIDTNKLSVVSDAFTSQVDYDWNKVFFAYESNYYIYLYIDINSALIIPKSSLDDEKLKNLNSILIGKLGNQFKNKTYEENKEEM